MISPPSVRYLLSGAAAGLIAGWLLPLLLGPPITAWGPSLRDNPRLSDAVVGAGGFLIYIAEAPAMHVGAHLTRSVPAGAAVNALGWTLIGLTIAGFLLAIRSQKLLTAGAAGGLLLGWMLPAVSQTLGEAFRHCWMHEGFLGTIALVGGKMLTAVGLLAELPWRLLVGPAESSLTPVLAMPVSAALWVLVGMFCAAGLVVIRGSREQHSSPLPERQDQQP